MPRGSARGMASTSKPQPLTPNRPDCYHPPMTAFATNEQIVLAARRNLSQGVWDYLVGGAESETTMRRNRLAFDLWAFRPRVLVDVSQADPSTTLLGHKLRIPVILSPVASLQAMHPEAALAPARAAAQFGTIQTLSCLTEPTLEDVADASDATKVFQLYVRGEDPWLQDVIGRVKAAGYIAIALTVDTALVGRRDRATISGYESPFTTFRFGANVAYQATATWDTLDRIREMAAPLPILLKGVATAEDAALAVEHGVGAVWVSNHGGRQLDHALGALETLPEVVEAVAGRVPVIVDGGVQRGSDILKAIALGADAVGIGKLQGWAISAGGTEALVRALEILESEFVSGMGLLGISRVDQLNSTFLRPADPVSDPHEMSAWVNIPGTRVT
ncbi:MAG: alpha-hydroxy-acid oxidizing protein [Dehalococcoidia bacterium]|nr:alpha-hydroxy-acid oxidizing protein [Dehalococcoidia bacterium]